MRKKIKLYFFNIYKNIEIKVLKKTQLEGFGIIEMLLLLANIYTTKNICVLCE